MKTFECISVVAVSSQDYEVTILLDGTERTTHTFRVDDEPVQVVVSPESFLSVLGPATRSSMAFFESILAFHRGRRFTTA